jgi:hypothetical protein
MKKLILLLAVAGMGFLSSCYQAHVCPTYTQQDLEQVADQNADNL